jgi:hypothetical protein
MHSINVFGRTKRKAKQNCSAKFFTPLLLVLIATSFFGVFLTPVAGQTTTDSTPDRIVSNEMELRNAVTNAVGPTVIALANDITLTEQLVIPANKDISLTSTRVAKFPITMPMLGMVVVCITASTAHSACLAVKSPTTQALA